MAKERPWTFQEWVESIGGVPIAAKLIGTKTRAIEAWKYSERCPSINNMIRIIEISKGRLTFQSIIESTHPRYKIASALS